MYADLSAFLRSSLAKHQIVPSNRTPHLTLTPGKVHACCHPLCHIVCSVNSSFTSHSWPKDYRHPITGIAGIVSFTKPTCGPVVSQAIQPALWLVILKWLMQRQVEILHLVFAVVFKQCHCSNHVSVSATAQTITNKLADEANADEALGSVKKLAKSE